MALTDLAARYLLLAHRRGVRFDRTLTLGRQHWLVTPEGWDELRAEFGLAGGASLRWQGWADAFFLECLGIRELDTLDNSDFEGATLLHDLNEPMPASWNGIYDVVFDGGTMEHVFNLPTALASCQRVLKVGGTMLWAMPSNNYCGHGFYQFSPELVFRTFSPAYGFKIENLLLLSYPFPGAELSKKVDCYRVKDPDEIQSRAQLVSRRPVSLVMEAVKVADRPMFRPWPQQSDYARSWNVAISGRQASEVPIFQNPRGKRSLDLLNRWAWRCVRLIPSRPRRWLTGWYLLLYRCNLRNRIQFTKVRLP
jgi:hypothetical protein